ncbi:MAG: hypothetical protein KGD72_06360 [Candidatus Lokiarchaeota archaeon]|nr:hypothetical protein [Candidatus Lokiarchaeota archaeon]
MKLTLKKNRRYIFAFSFLLVLIVLIFCNQLDKILFFPTITPEEWCTSQPCIEFEFFSLKIMVVQPSSTFFVYLLGFITIAIGIYLLRIKNNQKFISWWGLALLLWGIGAILAGTSYQAFSYEIKCVGSAFCTWTSLWELFYLLFSVGSVNAMLMAQAYLGERNKWSKIMARYAPANFGAYVIILVIGAIIPIQFMISFELMLLFLAPTILFLLIFNIWRYANFKKLINRSLVIIWVSLIFIIGLYFLYFMLDITNILWEQKIWFSENDILHIGLIIWMIYIVKTYSKNS